MLRMLIKKCSILIAMYLFLVVTNVTWAATTGKISGKAIDKSTGEALPGANIVIPGVLAFSERRLD